MKKLFKIAFAVLLGGFFYLSAQATHNRFGDITYEFAGTPTNQLRYKVTIRTCTKSSSPADRPILEIQWGDGTIDSLARDQIIVMGQPGDDVQQNLYIGYHTYPGPGIYTMRVFDANRNQGVINIPGSVNEPLCIETELVISPFATSNNSVVLEDCPCPEFACVGVKYCYNVSAHDVDGDSLSYELIPCKGDECDPIGGYQYPSFYGGTLTLDQQTGTLCWDSPQLQGEYNIAFKIHEWRRLPNGFVMEMGWVIRDMQITVRPDCNNEPPDLAGIDDTCVVAGTTLTFTVDATDPDNDMITLSEYGQPFTMSSNPASFVQNISTPGSAQGTFTWITDCSHVSNYNYPVYFIAEDIVSSPSVSLVDIQTMFIRVLPPPVQNVSAAPNGNNMIITWSATPCSGAEGYKIYRKTGSGFTPSSGCCEADAAEQAGFTLIGDVTNPSTTTFTDVGPLILGDVYCYVVVVYFNDGATSCPSEEDCQQLLMDVPVITHVSVGNTDLVSGIDTVRWVHPQELDTGTLNNFYYEVSVSQGFAVPSSIIYTTPVTLFLFQQQQELIVDNSLFNPLNTDDFPYTYNIRLNHSSGSGSTNDASSVFLTLAPNDNQIGLSWSENVPWNNTLYEVYRESSPGSGIWNLIGTTTQQNYIDTGLTNGARYCYKIRSEGHYSSSFIPQTLYNWSQEECASPIDLTPPCAPDFTIDSDCDIPINTLSWTNPNGYCADDVMQYNVYFTPVEGGEFELIMTFNSQFDTSFLHIDSGSIAGCYYITAVDSVQYGNESDPSNIICTDNCPSYWLPNVFSPNGDGYNDYFIPFPYKFVESVEMRIYNRWGQLVFETTDPDIRWDGTNMKNGEKLSEGVYYFTCLVNTIRLIGIDPVELNGYIHLMQDNNNNN